jgi:hypothetical protein
MNLTTRVTLGEKVKTLLNSVKIYKILDTSSQHFKETTHQVSAQIPDRFSMHTGQAPLINWMTQIWLISCNFQLLLQRDKVKNFHIGCRVMCLVVLI